MTGAKQLDSIWALKEGTVVDEVVVVVTVKLRTYVCF